MATYGTAAAITLSGSGQLLSQGLANNLNHVVRYNTVQEQSTTSWSSSTVGDAVGLGSTTASAHCTFTAWSLLGGVGNHVNNQASCATPSWFAHNQFAGGQFAVHPGLIALTNCLWERVALTLNNNGSANAWYLHNNLFRGGSITYSISGIGSLGMAYDNLFDRTSITRLGSSAYFTSGYNGYVANCNRFENSQGGDQVLTSNPVYQTGSLSKYYYPTTGGLLSALINAGSRQAVNAGLYSFTTTTNQASEGDSQVDIGFHYVALDASGNPLNSDGDGIPDYIPTPPTIVFGPLSQTVYLGDSVTFSVQAHGSPPFSYQWQFTPEGRTAGNISGATGSSFAFNNVGDTFAGSYSVQVFNLAGSTVSQPALLTLLSSEEFAVPVVGSRQDYRFKGDTTYYVDGSAGPVELYGTTVIEGGAVIKFASDPNAKLVINGPLQCQTSPWRPAIFTARDDDTVGYRLTLSTGAPVGFYASDALEIASCQDTVVENLRVAYAQTAIHYTGTTSRQVLGTVRHAQILHCGAGFVSEVTSSQPFVLNLANVLLTDVGQAIGGSHFRGSAKHLTVDHCASFASDASLSALGFFVTNSVFGDVTSAGGGVGLDGSNNGFYQGQGHIPPFGTHALVCSSSPFQTRGSGNYYLAEPTFRAAGTTAIDSTLLAALKTKTTTPPVALDAGLEVTDQLSLSPQVPRYASGPPDFGYYYDALDYTVANLYSKGGAITVAPGTAIAVRAEPDGLGHLPAGFILWETSAFVSHGTPNNPILITDVGLVQEGPPASNALVAFVPDFQRAYYSDRPPLLSLRFVNSSLANLNDFLDSGSGGPPLPTRADPNGHSYWANSSMYLSLQDCGIRGGNFNLGPPYQSNYYFPPGSASLANNLFDRVNFWLCPTYYGLVGDDCHR